MRAESDITMALNTYVGRLTDARRTRFTSSFNGQLYVAPLSTGSGPTGLISDRWVPITVDPDTGDFSMRIESSDSVRPPMLYSIYFSWQEAGVNQWSEWARFRAYPGGGNIRDMVDAATPTVGITYGYGPPTKNTPHGAYIDVSGETPGLYFYDGSA